MSGVELSRRRLLTAGGVAAGGLLLPGRALAAVRPSRTVTLTGTAFGTGNYQYHPFTVPRSVNRLDVRISKTGAAATGLGIFDPRGSHYATLERPNGFRGIYGEELPVLPRHRQRVAGVRAGTHPPGGVDGRRTGLPGSAADAVRHHGADERRTRRSAVPAGT